MEEDEETEEAKKRKLSERIVNRITCDSDNEKTQQQIHGIIMKRLESCSDDCDDPRKIKRSEIERQKI
jgi:hypothetical protein